MSLERMSSQRMTSSPVMSYTLPVEHLDYKYIQQCGDLKYLEKILHVLRSGREGVYPHLTEFCERRIATLDPSHRILWNDRCPATAASFSPDEWKHITDDLQAWQREIMECEQQFTQSPVSYSNTLPPVHNRTIQRSSNTTTITTHSKACPVPPPYSDWDRFDEECAKIEEGINKIDTPSVINHTHIQHHINISGLTQQEKCVLATREKEKGNEAFRVKDWDDAITYYTRSLCILPTVAGFNNRAQAEIKLQRWTDALRDCNAVLHIETHNFKALLRRATVYKHLENLQAALDDITIVLQSEPNNITAQKLLQEVNKKMNTELKLKPQPPDQLITDAESAGMDRLRDSEGQTGERTLRQTYRDMDRQTDRDMDRQTRRQAGGVMKGQRGGLMEGQTERQTGVVMEGQTERQTGGVMEGQTERQTRGVMEGQTERQTGGVRQGVGSITVMSEGNELYRSGQYADAAEKYSQSITALIQKGVYIVEDMYVLYSNRAVCFLKTGRCTECVSDCTRALQLKPFSVTALLRRAVACEALEHFRHAYVDYRTVQQIHNTHSVQQHVNRLTQVLMEQDGSDWKTKLPPIPFVPISARHTGAKTLLLSQATPDTHTLPTKETVPSTVTPPSVKAPPSTQCPATVEILLCTETPPICGPSQTRRRIPIIEVESDDDDGGNEGGDVIRVTSCPSTAFEFNQALNMACRHGDLVAGARLLRSVSPRILPQHISTQLDTHTLNFITRTLHTHILPTEPGLVYRLLAHLHTANRFTVAKMLMNSDEKKQLTQLFECLCEVECDDFTQEDINHLTNKFI